MQGQGVESLLGAGIALILLIFVVSIGAQILSETRIALRDTQDITVINESQTLNNLTITQLNNAPINVNSETVTSNNGTVVDSGTYVTYTRNVNYSITYSDGRITWLSVEGNNTEKNITYTYSTTDASTVHNVTSVGLDAINDFSGWFATIVVIIVAAFLIFFLISRFSGRLSV